MPSVWPEAYHTKKGIVYRIRSEDSQGNKKDLGKKFFGARAAYDYVRKISDTLASDKPIQESHPINYHYEKYLEYLDDRIQAGDKMKPSTKRIIVQSFGYFLPTFGEMQPNLIQSRNMEVFKNDLLRLRNVGGVNMVLRDIRTFFNWMVRIGELEKSPMYGVKFFDSTFKGYFLKRPEIATVYKKSSKRLWNAIYILKETGMRLGEFIGIDLPDMRAFGVKVTGKTGTRVVPLLPVVRYTLLKLLEDRWSYDGMEKAWRAMILEAKIINPITTEPPRIHDLRHTFASTYLAKGNSLGNLMDIGGWRTLSSVQKYIHPDLPNLLKTMQKRVK